MRKVNLYLILLNTTQQDEVGHEETNDVKDAGFEKNYR